MQQVCGAEMPVTIANDVAIGRPFEDAGAEFFDENDWGMGCGSPSWKFPPLRSTA
jgi:hypothetical protein